MDAKLESVCKMKSYSLPVLGLTLATMKCAVWMWSLEL